MLLRFENRRCVFSQCFRTKGPRVNSLNLNFAMSSSSPVKFIVVVSHVAVAMCVPRYCSERRPWQLTLVRLVFQSPAKKIWNPKLKIENEKNLRREGEGSYSTYICAHDIHIHYLCCVCTTYILYTIPSWYKTTTRRQIISLFTISTRTLALEKWKISATHPPRSSF